MPSGDSEYGPSYHTRAAVQGRNQNLPNSQVTMTKAQKAYTNGQSEGDSAQPKRPRPRPLSKQKDQIQGEYKLCKCTCTLNAVPTLAMPQNQKTL